MKQMHTFCVDVNGTERLHRLTKLTQNISTKTTNHFMKFTQTKKKQQQQNKTRNFEYFLYCDCIESALLNPLRYTNK